MQEKIQILSSVIVGEPFKGAFYKTGTKNITMIVLSADGNGPMGKYDIITLKFLDGSSVIIPAYYCCALNISSKDSK